MLINTVIPVQTCLLKCGQVRPWMLKTAGCVVPRVRLEKHAELARVLWSIFLLRGSFAVVQLNIESACKHAIISRLTRLVIAASLVMVD
jgi:hypothetical protein